MPPLDLTGPEKSRLNIVIGKAFTLNGLRRLLTLKLDRSLDDIVIGDDYVDVRFELIEAAEREGWTAELIAAAMEANPGNPQLVRLAGEYAIGARDEAFERVLRQASPFFDVDAFLTRLGEVSAQVCRVSLPSGRDTLFGTGFLVGPVSVMTNHHVLEPLIDGGLDPAAVAFQFDYKTVGGTVLSRGTEVRLADDWRIHHSPKTELDYAVVKIERPMGDEPVGEHPVDGTDTRGWVDPDDEVTVEEGAPLMILQHPAARPLKLALEMNGVISVTDERIRHRVNTEGGSSGSPCFDTDWTLVGLHSSGDPNFDPEYNEAVTMAAIVADLRTKGKLDAVARTG